VGLIALPPGSIVYIDANALIYAVERIEPYASLLRPVWEASRRGSVRLVGRSPQVVTDSRPKLRLGAR